MSQAFIRNISGSATAMAKKYGLFASVMMAQACLESGFGNSGLSDPPNHNLFGIKGTYNGQFVALRTAEQDSQGNVYYVTANFRKYPSYKESFEDNAKLLKNGLSWDSNYYKGTWKGVAKTYQDACKWLQGRYATDVRYAEKLINIIKQYNLTKYDEETTGTNNQTGVLNMSGKVTIKEQLIYVYDEPKQKYPNYLTTYKKGEVLHYDKVVIKNGFAWFEYTRVSTGKKAYMPFMPVSELWVTF